MRERLIEALLATPHARPASAQREVSVRCPFCGDSVKSNNTHLYIAVAEEIFKYDCKRCPASGFLTPEVLRRLGIFDGQLISFIKESMPKGSHKKILNDDGTLESVKNNRTDLQVHENDLWKLEYLQKRTNVEFDEKALDTYRVVVNFNQFLKENSVTFDPSKKDIDIQAVSQNCIGFLSHDGKSINFRNIHHKSGGYGLRYFIVSLDEKRRPYFYTPKTSFDPLAETPKFVTTEGPIGIIAVRKQFYTEDLSDVVFGASGSIGNLKQTFGRLTKLTCWLGAHEIHYSDPGISLSKYQDEIFSSYKGINRFSIVYNKVDGGRDFNDIEKGFETKVYQF